MSNFLTRVTRLFGRESPPPDPAALARQAGIAFERAKALQDAGRAHEAIAAYGESLALQPGQIEAWFNRAMLLRRVGRPEEALRDYDQVLALSPELMPAFFNRGLAYAALQDWPAALADFDRSVALNPEFAAGWSTRGVAAAKLGRFEEALQSYERAIALNGADPELHFNRGNALMDLARWDEAHLSFGRAIELRPDYVEAHTNRGSALLERRDVDASIASFERAIGLQPDAAEPRYNRALALLLRGDLAPGWADYEWRWERPQQDLVVDPSLLRERRWSGREDIRGRRLLVWPEQGLGDTLQFCRFVKPLADRGAEVILVAQPPLAELLRGLAGVTQLVRQGEPLPDFDLQCPLLSLPHVLGTTLATLPAAIPYLQADPDRVAHWREALRAIPAPRIGIAWAGNPANRTDRWRSIRLSQLLAGFPAGSQLISLQKDVPEADRATLAGTAALRSCLQPHHDFRDTAALMETLDLVICVDTAVAHLAGALGKPVWLLNRYNGCWRWLVEREDSPWYPTLRIFRQSSPGDWDEVMQRISASLRLLPR